jgi:tripartite-type tricarboxylate transporter receptor subunit TctC
MRGVNRTTALASRRVIAAAALAAGVLGASVPASAQPFPSRTISLVVGYAPGGTGDFVARLLSVRLAAVFGQSVVVENRAGASGAIAAQSVASALPDGHTLLVGQTPEIAINPHWLKGLNFDVEKDLQPIALTGVVPLVLVVPAKAPYATLSGMVAAARSAPNGLLFASAGTGTPGHFAGEVLRLKTGSNMTHVPYKGAGPALNDLLGGHVDFYFPGFPAAAPHVKAGTLKQLAVSSARRSAVAPDTPTITEVTGIKDFDFTLWVGIFAPRATPKAVVARLNGAINDILAQPDFKEKMYEAGADAIPMSVDEFTAFMRAESDKYLGIIRETGIKPE